jgi:hypothetical protein
MAGNTKLGVLMNKLLKSAMSVSANVNAESLQQYNTQFKDLPLKEVFKRLKFHSVQFRCCVDDTFMCSLEEEGYTEFHSIQSVDSVEKWNKSLHKPGAVAPIAKADTGDIYYEKYDCYYNVSITNIDYNNFDIDINPVAYPYKGE